MDYEWEAIYSDGTTLTQYNEKGEKNGYENIDATKLRAFAIHNVKLTKKDNKYFTSDEKIHFRLHLEPEQRLIYLRRGFLNTAGGKGSFLMVGWQQKINGKNIQSINYLYNDGHIEQSGVFAGGPVTSKSIK